jgi:hypothetical protein
MPTSTVPALRSTLKTTLAARPALNGVQILLALTGDPETDWIWIATAKGKQKVAAMRGGNNPRDETYDLIVFIRSIKSAIDDETAASDRVFALMAEIENTLRTDPSVSAILISGEISEFELEEWANGDQRGADLLVTLDCHARI